MKRLLAVFLTLSCSAAPERFYLKRRVPLPLLEGGEQKHLEVRELRYLLHTEAHDAANREALSVALGGDWRRARDLWRAPGETADCALWNNLGVSRSMTGDPAGALKDLSRALALCPDDEEIRWNYRHTLKQGESVAPRFRCEGDFCSAPPSPGRPE